MYLVDYHDRWEILRRAKSRSRMDLNLDLIFIIETRHDMT